MINDPLGDMLTRIRNGLSARLAVIKVPFSKLRVNVLEVLKAEGYIRDYGVSDVRSGIKEISVELKYTAEGAPAIRETSRVSKPGRRVYSGSQDVPQVYNGLGISILSTPRGVMSDKDARTANVGGEVLCRVF